MAKTNKSGIDWSNPDDVKRYHREKSGKPPFVKMTEEEKKAKQKEYNRKYYLSRPELRERHRQWHYDILEKTREFREQWLRENPEYESYILVPILKKEQREINGIIKRHQYNQKNKKKQKIYKKEYSKTHRDKLNETQRRYNQRNKEKVSCRITCYNAINSGKLKRQPCEICNTTKNIESHHDDYSKPLKFRSLCMKHHREFHRKVKNGYLIITKRSDG